MIDTLFKTYPTDITQHVIDAMTPSIEAEIKRVHEAVEAAKANALKEALKKFSTGKVANDSPPPVDPEPPVPPKPGKRRSFWDGKSAAERNAIMAQRWVVRNANKGMSGVAPDTRTCEPSPETAATESALFKEAAVSIRYASVCSGVEGLSLAWEPLGGFEPVFFSEIEPFPSAVLAKRWPGVPNLGDCTNIDGKEWKGKIDVLWSSLPCQSFSLSGNRKGAKDQRGSMFRPFLQLADDIAAPVIIMENVVGLRSDPAFREILRGLSGSDIKGRIARDGRHDGPSRRLAWRVLGSGTEQRRPRLFLVACSQSSGIDPATLLPQPEGFAPPRGQARQASGTAPQGSVVWLNADTTPKWSHNRVGTLRAAGGSAGRSLVCVDGRVRDLMPEERERLMGWDGQHTAVEFKGTEKTLDRLRNRAIGNSLALPPVRAIGEKVKTALVSIQGANDNAQPWSVIQGDCLAEMAKMADGSVDLIFTSPPYNLGDGGRRFSTMWKNAKLQDGYASYSDDMPHEEYVAWQKRFLLECWRLIPNDGAIFYQHKNRIQKGVLRTPHDLNPGLPIRQILVWARGNGMNFSHRFLTPSHELIYVFAKPGFRFEKGHGLKDVLTIEPERKNAHPAPFPVELPRQIIAATTAKVILDPFAGSGTTGVAALAEGRRFIGIELDPGYVEEAKARLLACAPDKALAAHASSLISQTGAVVSASQNSKSVDLRFGNCLAEMAILPAASVDLIAADLPYGTTACKWDRRINLDAFWKEVRRVLTPTGTVVLNSAGAFTADLIVSNRSWYKGSLVWVKTRKSQFLHAKHRPLVAHEDILVFSPAGACQRARTKMTYNPQGVVELPEARVFEKAVVSAGVFKPITTKASKRTQTHTGYPSTILTFASEGKNQHPTQKPVKLMEYLIETYSNPGDTVLDPTMGSGTTGVAAAARGRKFIGIEKEEKFFKIAQARIETVLGKEQEGRNVA